MTPEALQPGDAVLVVDVQNDFIPGGALPVPDGAAVVNVLNQWIAVAHEKGVPVFASRDWHPADHISFEAQGGSWPPHCVQETEGAAFHPDLELPEEAVIVTKADTSEKDAYSAFDNTDLTSQLRALDVERVWVGGLALDYCVRASMLDALEAGFEVLLIPDATRAITPETGAEALDELREAGAVVNP